ncbi:hypothetical protein GGR51DRAFT_561902 [Nemania sp. FL0031]|nr:hypothetical protein GGR51DRAFT_561902 [Nemania sp. FL0031]
MPLKEIMTAALAATADQGKKATNWAAENPGKAAALGTGAVLVAAPMMVAAPVLGVAGFGANGIVAGSVAAGVQSSIGNVIAPSVFAALQSAATGGYGVAAVSTAVQGIGGVVASSAGAMSILKQVKKQEEENATVEGDETSIIADEVHQEKNDDEK